MTQIINAVVEFFRNLLVSPIITMINNVKEYINSIDVNILPANAREFIGAGITTFVPINAVIVCISLLIPYYTMVLVFKVVLRIKSFVPTMGGK